MRPVLQCVTKLHNAEEPSGSPGGLLLPLHSVRPLVCAALLLSTIFSPVALTLAQPAAPPGPGLNGPAVPLTPVIRTPQASPTVTAQPAPEPTKNPDARDITVTIQPPLAQSQTSPGAPASAPDAAPAPAPTEEPAPPVVPEPTLPTAPAATGPSLDGLYAIPRVNGPEYGMNIFIWHAADTTDRDLAKVSDARFGWQKSLFQWRLIEPIRGQYNWSDADRVVRMSTDAGIKVIARVDFQPDWSRADRTFNGPPDNYDDYANFIAVLADRYKPGSPYGTISAIEMWNEPNIDRDWGRAPIGPASAADYVRLLCGAYQAAKQANPDLIVISGALTPTGVLNSNAADDVVYTQWMYDAGVKGCFDALGAHGAGYKAPPWIAPAELATNPQWGGDQSFGFRRTEQLRDVMVRNGDGAKQIWLTEFGWSSDEVHPDYAWHRVSEEEKADYVVEAYRWAYLHWQPWVGVMVLWNISAPDWTESREEYWWSVTNSDGTTRPAYDALVEARASGYLPDPN